MPPEGQSDVESRETLLAEATAPATVEAAELFKAFLDLCDTDEAAPSAGLRIHTEKIVSAPDGNTINLQVIRPDTDETIACVYYIHGGGMASLSCYDGMYRGWGKLIAANRVAVVMVDFRNWLGGSLRIATQAPAVALMRDATSVTAPTDESNPHSAQARSRTQVQSFVSGAIGTGGQPSTSMALPLTARAGSSRRPGGDVRRQDEGGAAAGPGPTAAAGLLAASSAFMAANS